MTAHAAGDSAGQQVPQCAIDAAKEIMDINRKVLGPYFGDNPEWVNACCQDEEEYARIFHKHATATLELIRTQLMAPGHAEDCISCALKVTEDAIAGARHTAQDQAASRALLERAKAELGEIYCELEEVAIENMREMAAPSIQINHRMHSVRAILSDLTAALGGDATTGEGT